MKLGDGYPNYKDILNLGDSVMCRDILWIFLDSAARLGNICLANDETVNVGYSL